MLVYEELKFSNALPDSLTSFPDSFELATNAHLKVESDDEHNL